MKKKKINFVEKPYFIVLDKPVKKGYLKSAIPAGTVVKFNAIHQTDALDKFTRTFSVNAFRSIHEYRPSIKNYPELVELDL